MCLARLTMQRLSQTWAREQVNIVELCPLGVRWPRAPHKPSGDQHSWCPPHRRKGEGSTKPSTESSRHFLLSLAPSPSSAWSWASRGPRVWTEVGAPSLPPSPTLAQWLCFLVTPGTESLVLLCVISRVSLIYQTGTWMGYFMFVLVSPGKEKEAG